jgi:peptide/nickel transport system substrate-binding protein
MKRLFIVLAVALSMVILISPYISNAASPTAAVTGAGQPQTGGILKIIDKNMTSAFGYPPKIVGASRNFAIPFFDHLIRLGEDGKYHPGLALSWDSSKDGKTITLKLRKDVTFHDGTPFNAPAVKSNIDNLIPPKATVIPGITSVDVVDDYTVKLNLSEYNNLIYYHLAVNPLTYIYSPEALKKNGEDWALTHPVGTGPFILKDYQPNTSISYAKNSNYWQKGLPYLDGIEIAMVPDAMTSMLSFKSGQAKALCSAPESVVAQLKSEGYPYVMAKSGNSIGMNFDTANSEYFSKRPVREAIEYAIDKEAICSGPGLGVFKPMYQIVSSDNPGYNKACPPRKYDPAKAKKLLAEAGYPDGFSFKLFFLDTSWKDGFVAIQSYLDKVGIKMEITAVNASGFALIRGKGQIEKGAAAYQTYASSTNTLYMLDSFWRTPLTSYQYRVLPRGIDELIAKAKLLRDNAAITKINQQISKLIYDDATFIPLFDLNRINIVDKSLQNTGWFIYGEADSNEFGTRTWLKK